MPYIDYAAVYCNSKLQMMFKKLNKLQGSKYCV